MRQTREADPITLSSSSSRGVLNASLVLGKLQQENSQLNFPPKNDLNFQSIHSEYNRVFSAVSEEWRGERRNGEERE
jgi:hypothetical protein